MKDNFNHLWWGAERAIAREQNTLPCIWRIPDLDLARPSTTSRGKPLIAKSRSGFDCSASNARVVRFRRYLAHLCPPPPAVL